MHGQDTAGRGHRELPELREVAHDMRGALREVALHSALAKRAAGVPTYSVPEVAALLSVSAEHVYRLIKSDSFPAVLMAVGGRQGRYVVPAAAVERLLGEAATSPSTVDTAAWTAAWRAQHAGGAA